MRPGTQKVETPAKQGAVGKVKAFKPGKAEIIPTSNPKNMPIR